MPERQRSKRSAMRKLFLFVVIGLIFTVTYGLNFDSARAERSVSSQGGGKSAPTNARDRQSETTVYSIVKAQQSFPQIDGCSPRVCQSRAFVFFRIP